MVNVTIFVRSNSKKTNLAKVGFRLIDGRKANVFYTSNIMVDERLWDHKRQNFKANLRLISEELRTTTLNEINRVRELLISIYNQRDPEVNVNSDWIKSEIDRKLTNKNTVDEQIESSFFDSFDYFISNHRISDGRKNSYWVIYRLLQRFEKFKQMKNLNFKLSFKTLNSDLLREIEDYLRKENEYYIKYPKLFKNVPDTMKPKKRGDNTLSGIFKKIRTFTLWSMKRDNSIDDPFNDYKLIKEKYGSPIYLNEEERNKLYLHDFSDKPTLEIQRDIFVFQCFVGCRVGDFYKMTKKSVDLILFEEDGETKEKAELGYIAGKTKDGDPKTITVPLSNVALTIYKKYLNVDSENIFPFISMQKYNDNIRKMCKKADLNRIVTVLNPTTKEVERKHLYEIVNSHIARKTFTGIMYKKIGDQRIVSSMTGHTPNSKEFGRYAEVDEEMKREAIRKIDF